MAYPIFSGYLIFFTWLIGRIPFFCNSGIPLPLLRIFFLLKVAAGVAYGYLAAGVGDTWEYHTDSLKQLALLHDSPLQFFVSFFRPGYSSGYGGFFEIAHSWWNDLDWHFLTRLLAIFNLFSGSHYYTNVIFYNAITLTGPVLLFRVWRKATPRASAWLHYLPFLVASVLFWTSGIHKEGFLLLAIALVVHALFAYSKDKDKTFRRLLQFMTGLGLMLVLRNFLLLPAGAALLSWILTDKIRLSAVATLSISALLGCIIFFGFSYILPNANVADILYERRTAFLKKSGDSKIDAVQLAPTPASFIRNAPAAFVVGAFRPPPGDVRRAISGFAAAENVAFLMLLAFALYRLRHTYWNEPFLQFCLYFTIPCFLIIGYTIPFLGAVVRYRSIALPFWTMALLVITISKQQQAEKV